MQNRGIGPAISSRLANSIALRIVYHATCWTDAIEDNEAGREVKRRCRESGRPLGSLFASWSNGAGPQRFLIIWPGDHFSFSDDLIAAFGDLSSDPKYHGAVIVFDLQALGAHLVEKAGRPLAAIDFADEDDAKKSPADQARKLVHLALDLLSAKCTNR